MSATDSAPAIDPAAVADKDSLLGPILQEQEAESTIKSQVHTMYSLAASSWSVAASLSPCARASLAAPD